MWKTKKFILAAVLAIIVLVGSTAGVVFARTGSGGPAGVVLTQTENGDESQSNALLDRVCEILQDEGINITPEQLKDAFADARSQMRDEALDSYLQKLVDEGKITDIQAGEYKAWLEAIPNTPLPGPFGRSGFPGFGMKRGGGHPFWGGTCPSTE